MCIIQVKANRKCADVFSGRQAVEGQELGNIDNRVTWQSGRSGRQQDIARRFGEQKVARDYSHDHGLNAAPVKGAGLDDQHGPAEAGFGATGLRQVSPPNLTTGCGAYQESFWREFNWASWKAGSSLASS